MKCFIPGCEDIGLKEIKDAVNNPIKYNGMLLCKNHFEERKYMQENDKFDTSSQIIESKELITIPDDD